MRFFKTNFAKLLFSLLLLGGINNASKAQTTLVAGDIAFTGYLGFGASANVDEFSFVLLKNITSGTVINFTDNGWLSTNVFRTGETTVTWTSNSTLSAGQEIKIVGTTPTLASGAGTAGIVSGTALSLSANGDQILAYQGTAAAPTFISAIHMNVYDAINNVPDPSTTTAAAWDGIANTANSSALPTGLTTGTNAIWIGTQSNINSEKDNARFVCAGDLSTVASIKGLIYDQTKWTTSDGDPAGFALPTGCSYITAVPAPSFTTQPTSSSICAGANTSFTIVATGAITYQWQVDNGGGFVNLSNDAIYSNVTTTTLNITAAPFSFNGYLYRCVATNGTGPTNSTSATLTVTALPTTPTLLAKTPNTSTVADGTPVSATFNAGSGGTGCADDYRYTTNGGASYLPYTPGSNISTTGLAAGSGTVTIEGRRANCSAGCQGAYSALASWIVTPLPAGATTLNAGDIAFSGYTSSTANSDFSFVLLRNIGPGTAINFTDNGWLSTNVFRTGETTVTWTSNAAYSAGTEIKISAIASTLTSGASAGTVTGTALSLATIGDQILAYRGSAAAPTFISAIHMNVYTVANGDPVTTTAAAWDGTANTTSASALPTGLTTGVNAIWIGVQGDINSEFDNAQYGTCSNPATFGPIATLRAALNNPTNWTKDNNVIPSFVLPTGCSYLGIGASPTITTQPIASSICAGANTSFIIAATSATTYQWQVDNGGGFINLANDATYSNVTTTTLNITAATIGLNGYLYRCIATNGSGSTNSNSAALTVAALPANPTLLAKTPAAVNVADGTPVSATFTAGSGGTGCTDDFRYTTDGGVTYLPYTPGANISTTGLAAGSGTVFIEGRRANCSAGCQGEYSVLASWTVTPIPVAATTLNAGDIAFSGYNSNTGDDFSFVLLRNIGPGTIINFTNNGWLSTNVFRTGEESVTWTAPVGGLSAGTEIRIAGLTATKASGGAAGTVTGTPLTLSVNGDQILAYRGLAASPTFIAAIHTNVYTVANSDPVTTTAAAWDGTANTVNASAIPTGLTTGVNAIWIGTQGDINSEFDNAKYSTCSNPATLGSLVGLRTALNNQANWSRNNTPPGFTLPTGCNYLSVLVPSVSVTGTPLTPFTSCIGSVSVEQSFSVSGTALTTDITITAPSSFEISTTSGSGFTGLVTLTQSGGSVSATTIYIRMSAAATGIPSGNVTVASSGVTTINVAVNGTLNPIPIVNAGANQAICAGASATLVATCNLLAVTTTLSGANEVPPNASTATGIVKGTFDNTTNQLILNISFSGLTANASAAHIHRAAVGVNGGVVIGFTGVPAATTGSFTYTGTLTATQAADLLAGLYYVNVHNSSFPGGEIRGQLSTICAANTFSWDNGGGTGQTVSVTPAITTIYTLTSSNSVTGCSSTSQTTVTVNPLPATPTITAGGPTTFCTGGSVVLTSSSATGNTWSTGATTPSITISTAGTYTVTVTNAGCTSAPSAGTTVTVDALPTTAAAGPDATACINPGTFTMAANTAAVGTGVWAQVPGGPSTAVIFTSASPVSNIAGLTTAGVYTFVWTISNGACTPSRDTMTITVNLNPAAFTLTGGGTFCPGTTTLTGPVDPNYNYTWQRSLSGIANPNSFTNFGGTTFTQDVTSSGNYRLIVTNQFGCSTSDTTPVSMADLVFNGSLATGDAQQTGRLNRFAVLSTCAAPKTCPLTFTTTGARFYDSYNISNPRSVPVCATIGLRSDCGTSLFNVAYLGSFDPTAPCTNYLADPGSSFPGTGYMEVTIPANASIVVVVHEVNPATGCAGYQLTVDVPRETGVTVSPSTPVCSATAVTLTAPIASSYSWNPGGNTTQAISVSPTVTSKYYVTLGYGNVGCNTIDSGTVVVNPLPTVALAGNDTAACGLIINNLAANTAVVGTGTWTLVTGPGTVNFGNANAPNSSATASVNGVYTLRWTIATSAPCASSSQDDVLVNFAATPSVADAGLDKTACLSPGRTTMTATVPTAGSGVWTQVAGPVTANIISPTVPNTNITGLNTLGTYTFRWTVSNNPCPSNFDEVDVVVNGNPASFSITGGGTYCPSGTTLAGPVDPNYTYQWGKSYLTAPFTSVGTAQTLAVTSSGIYELVVTNQFGCSTSNTTVVNASDYVFNGSLATGDAVQTGRLNRFAAISTCAAPKVCPGTFTTTGSRLYDSYTITNPRPVPICAVIGLNSGCGTAVFSAAYSGSYDPNAQCTNYLADPGSSPSTSIFYEATIPANGTIVVVVHEVNPSTGCANYTLTVDVPRDGAPIVINPPTVTCASTATLTAPIASTYLWSPGGATTRSVTTTPLFTNTQYKVTLGYGNNGCSRADSATVTVSSAPPTVSCPANINLTNTTGLCGRAVTYTTAVGGTPTPTLTYAFTGATTGSGSGNGSGSTFNVGVTNVTVTATNACGSVNCSFTVTITDNQAPTVTTGTISSCYSTVSAAEAAALAATSATDNCPGALIEVASIVGACSAVVTVRTTDVAGNFTDVTYNTRIDNTAPTVTIGTISSCYPTVAAAEAAALAATSASDNCPDALTEVASTVGTCSAVVTVTTTDGCGNATAITYNTRIDNIAPTVTCPIAITVCGAAGVPAANITTVTATDNCPGAIIITFQGDVSTPSTTAPYVITRTYRATDGCGNFTECTQLITVNPIATVNAIANQVVCNASPTTAVSFSSTATGGTIVYNWTNNTPSIGLAASGSGNIASFTATNTTTAPVIATITVTPSYTNAGVTCVGTATTYTYTVNPTATVNTVANQVVCNNANTTAVNFSSPTTGGTIVYNWTNNTTSIGLAASGSGNIPTFVATNTTTAPVTATITVTPSYTNAGVTCVGTPITYTYTVNPTATVTAVTNQVVCNNSPTTAVVFTSPTTGGTIVYNWTNNTTSIGLAATGVGNIASFNATNTTTAPVTATITVTPTFTNGAVSCVGTPRTFTITVNPTATVTTVANQVVCNNSPVTAVAFTSPTTGGTIVYNWTNNTTSIGLAASGVGNIASFNGTNTTTAPVTATITVTPTFTNGAVSCVGTPITFTITVNPTPLVNTVANQTLCNGASTLGVNFTSPTTGGTIVYNWTNNTTSIGLAASGAGNIPSFVAVNTGTTPVVATISIIASYTNGGVTCTGPTQTFTVTVNPTPVVTLASFAAICRNAAPLTLTGGSPVNGTGGGVGIYFVNGVAQTVFNPANYSPGFHTIVYQFTNSFGCVRSATQQIQVYPIHTVEITLAPNTGVRPGVPVTAIATVSPVDNYTYTWTKNNVLVSGATADRITVLGNDAGNYKVTVTAPTGCVVVSDNAFTSSAISSQLFIFPNPNTGLFNVSYNNGDANLVARTLSVYDATGAKVFSKTYSVNVPYGNMVVDIRNKARGQYYVLLLDSNGKKLASATVQKL
jgi:CHRD domain/Secretion system C-terminal sorting domain